MESHFFKMAGVYLLAINELILVICQSIPQIKQTLIRLTSLMQLHLFYADVMSQYLR